MPATPSTVITMGYGSFGSVNLLPTLGYGQGATSEGRIADVYQRPVMFEAVGRPVMWRAPERPVSDEAEGR